MLSYNAAMYKLIDFSLHFLRMTRRITESEYMRFKERNKKLKSEEFLASKKRKK